MSASPGTPPIPQASTAKPSRSGTSITAPSPACPKTNKSPSPAASSIISATSSVPASPSANPTPPPPSPRLPQTQRPASSLFVPRVPGVALVLFCSLFGFLGTLTLAAPGPAPAPAPAPAYPLPSFLPPQTLASLTIPSVAQYRTSAPNLAPFQLWQHPASQPFRDDAHRRLQAQIFSPLQSALPLDWLALIQLTQGLACLAYVPSPSGSPAPLLVLDLGSQIGPATDLLQTALPPPSPTSLIHTQSIASIPVLHCPLPQNAARTLAGALTPFPDTSSPHPSPPTSPTLLQLAIVGPWFVATTATNLLPSLIPQLLESPPPPPPPLPHTPETHPPLLHARFSEAFLARALPLNPPPASDTNTSPSTLPRLIRALGLTQLQGLDLTLRSSPTGWTLETHLSLPATRRFGLFSLLQPLPFDASPPPSIPDHALQFARLRLDGPTSWLRLQKTLADFDPAVLGLVQLLTEYAGRTEDPDFQFEAEVIRTLGDDLSWTSLPTTNGPRSLLTLQSPQAARLFRGLQRVADPAFLSTFLPPSAPPPSREIHSLANHPTLSIRVPEPPWNREQPAELHVTHHQDRLHFATHAPTLAAWLQPTPSPTLAQHPAFATSLAAAGGPLGGFVHYRNERLDPPGIFPTSSPAPPPTDATFSWLEFASPLAPFRHAMTRWFDPSLLPTRDIAAPFFHHAVTTIHTSTNGFLLRSVRLIP